jgi:hypothetical protein
MLAAMTPRLDALLDAMRAADALGNAVRGTGPHDRGQRRMAGRIASEIEVMIEKESPGYFARKDAKRTDVGPRRDTNGSFGG